MRSLYRIYKVMTNPKTFENKVKDMGTTERYSGLASWNVTKDLSYPVLSNFRYETDQYGVKVATYIDPVGNHYKEVREKILDQISLKKHYQPRQKVEYYAKRVNDKTLTASQREFAQRRLVELKKII